MARAQAKSKSKSKKTEPEKRSLLFRLLRLLIAVSALFIFAFCIYALIAAAVDWRYKPIPGSNINSEKIPVSPKDLKVLVESDNSREISTGVIRMIETADKFLLLDMERFPESKDNILIERLLKAQKLKPNLNIILIFDASCRKYSLSCPGIFNKMVEHGIKIIFSDISLLRSYRWLYSPGAAWISGMMKEKDVSSGENSNESLHSTLDRWQNKTHARNIMLSETPAGYEALMGDFSFPQKSGTLQIAELVKGQAVLPIIKSELFIAREFLSKPGNGFSKDGEAALLRAIEQKLKSLPLVSISCENPNWVWLEYLSEKAALEKLLWALGGLSSSDSVDILAGMLDDERVIQALNKANSKGCSIRIIFDKNISGIRSDTPPGLPNAVAAAELYESNKKLNKSMAVRWLEGLRTNACFALVTSETSGSAKLLMSSSSWNVKTLGGYDMASAIYVDGKFSGIEKLKDLFDSYWRNRKGLLRTSDYADCVGSFSDSISNKATFHLKSFFGGKYKVEKSE